MGDTGETGDLLDRYTPVQLSPEAWELARPVVISAIREVPRASDELLSPMVAQVCWLLARPGVWDQESALELTQVLTPEVIEQATSEAAWPEAKKATRGSYRRNLRRLGRTLGSVPERRLDPTPVAVHAQKAWRDGSELGPFTAVVAAGDSGAGRCMRGLGWDSVRSWRPAGA